LRWIKVVDERVLAVLGKFVLYSQPVAAFYEAKRYSFILPYIVIQSITELIYGSRDFRFLVAKDGHFEWKWIKSPLSIETIPYWIGLLLGGSFIFPMEIFILMAGLFTYFYIITLKTRLNLINTQATICIKYIHSLYSLPEIQDQRDRCAYHVTLAVALLVELSDSSTETELEEKTRRRT
jgi:hypothetical protein